MASREVRIAASILTADFGNLSRVVRKLERSGVDRLHLDVMDAHFVPNLTFGADVVAAFRRLSSVPLDTHLMISHPSRWLERYLEAGSDTVTFHVEAPEPPEVMHGVLARIREAGSLAGLAVSPRTPVEAVAPFVGNLDIVMIMTVEPGFGGQRFRSECIPKIDAAAALLGRARGVTLPADGAGIHVDGGVNRETAALLATHPADVLVVGSALFQRGRDAADEVRLVREGGA